MALRQFQRWRELQRWRHRQRAALASSNHLTAWALDNRSTPAPAPTPPGGRRLPEDRMPTGAGTTNPAADTRQNPTPRVVDTAGDPASAGPATPATAATGGATAVGSPLAVAGDDAEDPALFGRAGRPLDRKSPFFIGFIGALGVLVAVALWGALGQMGAVFTLLLVAVFLALALDPVVQFLTRRGMRRGLAVTVVFLGLLAVFAGVGFIVVPPVAAQAGQLASNAPGYFADLMAQPVIARLNNRYHLLNTLQTQVQAKLSDGTFLTGVFGGVLGVGQAVVSGVFAGFTVLVLTLYFLGALPAVKRAGYATVPTSRRTRVSSLSEEVMRRVGSYAIGQVAIASANAVMSFVMMSIVGIPYPAVLAVAVGFLGLVPMVGAGLGAVVVATVAVFDEPHKAVIAISYYVVYQQLENYLIVPRIMQRTVSVPGAVTIIAALAGGTLLGMLGALLAIPVAAGMLLLYEEVLLPRQHRA